METHLKKRRGGLKRTQFKYLATNLPFGWFSGEALNLLSWNFIFVYEKKIKSFFVFISVTASSVD